MISFISTSVVILTFGIMMAIVAASHDRAIKPLLWVALVEYFLCATAQLIYSQVLVEGGDTLYYSEHGELLVRVVDLDFNRGAREILLMLVQQRSDLDKFIELPESNTGSMCAIAAILMFMLRSSVAVHFFIAGLSLFGALGIFTACRHAQPDAPPKRLFAATVLFPSVAFWTSALHKEAFCLLGVGLLLSAWRAVYTRQLFRVFLYGPLGVAIILIFRAPALPPLVLGLGVYLVGQRLKRSRGGGDAALVGPVYLVVGLALFALGMVIVGRVMPALGVEQVGDTMLLRQQQWASQSRGGSGVEFGDENPGSGSLAAQLVRLPLALLNALFRPQLFDVHNVPTLLGAVEMTVLTLMIIRVVRHHGTRVVQVVQRSPFLLMCTVITVVGCTLFGLVTLNLGSLARYRAPFLPFYGALLVTLSPRAAAVVTRPGPQKKPTVRRSAPLRTRGARTQRAT